VKEAYEIIVIESGAHRGTGTHAELLARDGYYAD